MNLQTPSIRRLNCFETLFSEIKPTIALGIMLIAVSCVARSNEIISLAGDWRFELSGTNSSAFSRELQGKIHLPGTMDDAGLGPTNVMLPTLYGPYRLHDYAGPAWYQREVEIPAEWRGRRLTLFLERCRWVTTVWLDGQRIGSQDSLIAPHVYDLGLSVWPGKHRLTICVDNTLKLDLGPFPSALRGGTWGNMNGIIGRIELASTAPVWLDDVQVYPDVDKKLARVVVKIGNATGKPGHAELVAGGKSVEAFWDKKGGRAEMNINMNGVKLWDEFAPNLCKVVVKLGDDQRSVKFGMRKFEARGTQFAMNGRLIYLRGTLECSVFPLTGYPPTDVLSWQRIIQVIKSYGLNLIRFHSWCPPEAAFEAADIEGMMLQVEGPVGNVDAGLDSRRDAFVAAELKRIQSTYGNHPSFCLLTTGNEFRDHNGVEARWVESMIERDPRQLHTSSSSSEVTPHIQWREIFFGRGVHGAGTEYDLHDIVAGHQVPVIGHEIGQWAFFPDFNEIKEWTGVMALRNFEMIRDDMDKKHLLKYAPAFAEASGLFSTLLYKEEIEILLRTRGYGGFSLLDLHDYPTQGTALVGVLNAFWQSKGFITPEAFLRFCSPTVPLLRMPQRAYVCDESFVAKAEIAHYGPADLRNAQPVWTIRDGSGRVVCSGKLPTVNVPTGGLTELGEIRVSLVGVSVPAKLKVTLAVSGTEFVNDWDIWVYPANLSPQPPENVVVSEDWAQARAALSEGKKVVFFAPLAAKTDQSMAGSFLPVFWVPGATKPSTMSLICDPKHPLFASFPTETHSDWQWYDLMEHSRLFNLDATPADYQPTLQVVDNFVRNDKLGLIFEARVGGGQLLACGFDLPRLTNDPAACQLLSSLYHYVGSTAFEPTQALGDGLLEKLFAPRINHLQKLGATISADSQASGEFSGSNVIDCDPETIWHTPWGQHAPHFPHELTVEWSQPTELGGITCRPRQDGSQNGWIKDYSVYISNDGKNWGEPVAIGTFPQNAELQVVRFAAPVKTRCLKLVAKSSFDSSQPYSSLADLDVIPIGQP